MKWSLDTHKFVSEIVRTALQVIVNRRITGQSGEPEIKAAEQELFDKGVYRSRDGADGRIRRALFTYFKAYHFMTQDGELTEFGKAFYNGTLSVKEACLHFIFHYKYSDDQSSYYPLNRILSYLQYCEMQQADQALSLEVFELLVDGVSDSDELYSSIFQRRSESRDVDARNIGFDVWSYMLIESGLLEKVNPKTLRIKNKAMSELLLNAYANMTEPGSADKIEKGYLPFISIPSINQRKIKKADVIEAKTLCAYLFDGIDDETVDRYICPKGGSLSAMLGNYGLTESNKGAFAKYIGYEHLVGWAWAESSTEQIKELGKSIIALETGIVEPNSLYEIIADEPLTEEETVTWFKSEAQKVISVDEEAEQLYGEFRARFGPEVLQSLDGLDLLHRMFINETDKKDNLCYTLEYDKRYDIFGSVAGGFAYKYILFYSWDRKSWVTGSSRKNEKVSEERAIEIGKSIRDELVKGCEIISNYGELNSLQDYADLHAKLYEVMPNTIGKAWVMMYFHMIFPDKFPVFYNEEWQKKALDKANIDADENSFMRMGQIALFVKKCGISNVSFFKVLLNTGDKTPTPIKDEVIAIQYNFDTSKGGAQNKVVYGTPGCGKSYYVQNVMLPSLGVDADNVIRTTFYQDYTNTEFVGQILPKVDSDGGVTYEFNPGPFTLALKKAIEQPEQAVALVIEELNRGNAPSIFGDIFQLLDRDENGKSQYAITNVNIQNYLNKCFDGQAIKFNKIFIPANLYIISTMNTSDQNVFTLDTAFKRRWLFEKIRNDFKDDHEYKGYFVPGMDGVTWEQLVKGINDFILNRPDDLTSEDKLIGVYFIDKHTLCEKEEDCGNEEKKYRFAYKLFEYLWDDVAKFAHTEWFGSDIKSLDQLIDAYMTRGKSVLEYVLKQN